ncbi:hypothetical protein [Metabacillus iocasae]|uniref:Uncharacterized protein n=1 Tax=Priestia iocasae TaxID=2291674 RepID=A0ABS2QWS5_9BACI|nr:hypothetical protein [Metabacillus iocasae]MBM7703934.1 hypothetical protein [Metabacillus iocasae]
MVVWYFVLAAVIATVGMLFIYRSTMQRVEEIVAEGGEEEVVYQKLIKEQTPFFIKHAVLEIVPLILVVLGFMTLETSENVSPAPLAVAVIVWIGTVFMVFQTNQAVLSRQTDNRFNSFLTKFMLIEMALMSAFPIIAIVGTLTAGV